MGSNPASYSTVSFSEQLRVTACYRFFTRFSLQSTAGMSENSGSDAPVSPYEHRQNVVVRLCMFLLLEQERAAQDPCAKLSVRS